ncbi:hypothetical protein ACLOJK_014272 [Asimina triloba]
MDRRLRAFHRWMRSQGIECSDALQLADGADGIAVRARCDLKEGDVVATIPVSACLTIKTTACCEMIEDAGLAGSLGLSLALMYERSLGEASLWSGYLQLLPDEESVPLLWTLEEVDSLLMGTELHKTVKEDKALLYEDWKECIQPLIANGPVKLDPESFGAAQYFAAKSLVGSRSFEIDGYHGFGMVPLADLFNHKTGAENVHFFSASPSSNSDSDNDSNHEEEDIDECKSTKDFDLDSSNGDSSHLNSTNSLMDSAVQNFVDTDDVHDSINSGDEPAVLEMGIVKAVKEGDEVFNTYGSMGNAALLHRYGFTEFDNSFDIVNIDLSLVMQWISKSFSSRYCRARLSLWRRLDCSGCTSQNSEYFEISGDGEPQLELLILLHIVFLPEEAYSKLNYAASSTGDVGKSMNVLLLNKNGGSFQGTREMSREFLLTASIRSALVSLADARENLYGSNSMEDDMDALRICCRLKERKQYHSLVLRISERMILKKLRLYAATSFRKKRKRNSSRR